MKCEMNKEIGTNVFTEKTVKKQVDETNTSALYIKAFLENDKGVSSEYCLNTTTWD